MKYEVPKDYRECVQLWKNRGIVDISCLGTFDREVFLEQMGFTQMIKWGAMKEVRDGVYE